MTLGRLRLVVRLMLVLSACLMQTVDASPDSISKLELNSLLTPEGWLMMRQGAACYHCFGGAYLNGKQILEGEEFNIDYVFPSVKNPKLVTISRFGGNCCGRYSYLLDFSTKPHLVIEDFAFGDDISESANGVVFTSSAGRNELGDFMLGVYEYRWGSGTPVLKKRTPIYPQTPLNQKQTPSDILDDPILREPLVELLGKKGFARFRNYPGAAVPERDLKFLNDSVVIGAGCFPHDCVEKFGLFIIDYKRKLAWAVEGENRSAKIWGAISSLNELEKREVSRWLSEHMIPESAVSVIPIPQAMSQKYETNGANIAATTLDPSGTLKLASDSIKERHDVLSPIQLFKILAPAIFVVNATKPSGDAFQGSAVAVSSTELLTNCHVVTDSASITLEQKGSVTKATLVSADVEADRCVIRSDLPLQVHVPIRPYDSLQVGEKVYSIGAPAGLELTISDGLLSGKRSLSNRRLVQTTAAISPGSSGGGLFDETGNLIGITTFHLKDSENLNFAISAEDYLHP
jgi:hypothetical protein